LADTRIADWRLSLRHLLEAHRNFGNLKLAAGGSAEPEKAERSMEERWAAAASHGLGMSPSGAFWGGMWSSGRRGRGRKRVASDVEKNGARERFGNVGSGLASGGNPAMCCVRFDKVHA